MVEQVVWGKLQVGRILVSALPSPVTCSTPLVTLASCPHLCSGNGHSSPASVGDSVWGMEHRRRWGHTK